MGGRNGIGMIMAAGMVAMASAAMPGLTTGSGERKSRGGDRIIPPRVDRRDKSVGLKKMLSVGRRRGRC